MGLLIAVSFVPAMEIELSRRLYAHKPELVNQAYFSFGTILAPSCFAFC